MRVSIYVIPFTGIIISFTDKKKKDGFVISVYFDICDVRNRTGYYLITSTQAPTSLTLIRPSYMASAFTAGR